MTRDDCINKKLEDARDVLQKDETVLITVTGTGQALNLRYLKSSYPGFIFLKITSEARLSFAK
jgi:hypothetical protein